MSGDEVDQLTEACRKALERLGPTGSFRLRTLISMVLHELRADRVALKRREERP